MWTNIVQVSFAGVTHLLFCTFQHRSHVGCLWLSMMMVQTLNIVWHEVTTLSSVWYCFSENIFSTRVISTPLNPETVFFLSQESFEIVNCLSSWNYVNSTYQIVIDHWELPSVCLIKHFHTTFIELSDLFPHNFIPHNILIIEFTYLVISVSLLSCIQKMNSSPYLQLSGYSVVLNTQNST